MIRAFGKKQTRKLLILRSYLDIRESKYKKSKHFSYYSFKKQQLKTIIQMYLKIVKKEIQMFIYDKIII